MVLIYIYKFFIYVNSYIYNFIYMFNHTYLFYTHIWVCIYILTNMLWEMINKPTKHLSQIKSRTQKNTGRTTKKRKWIEQNVSGITRMIFLHRLCNKNKINRIGRKQLQRLWFNQCEKKIKIVYNFEIVITLSHNPFLKERKSI